MVAAERFELAPPKRLVSHYGYRSVTLYFAISTKNTESFRIRKSTYYTGTHQEKITYTEYRCREGTIGTNSRRITKLIRKTSSIAVLRP